MFLEVSRLNKQFGAVEALRGLDLAVEEGEFFALLGPSAAGKTTTLRCLTGIERADSGSIVFQGRDITHAPVQGRPMAMVFQSFALYPHLTVRENLAYPLREAGVKRADSRRRVDQIAELLGLQHTLERKPETASGGEQQRIAIGRALIREPTLLLLDEPITNLDAKLRHDTRAEFKRLHRDLGMTIVYATPDELEALSMGQRIAVIDHGRIVQTGSPDALYLSPRNTLVASTLGSPKMNLLSARRHGRGGVEVGFGAYARGPWSTALEAFSTDTPLLFGFRAHDVHRAERDDPATIRSTVHLTEPLGDITVLDLEAGHQAFKMVLAEDQAVAYRAGDTIDVRIDLDQTHVFAAETGITIR